MNDLMIQNEQATKAVTVRRQMAATPELLSRLEPVEKGVFLASTAKPIYEYEPTELTTELQMALKWIAKDTGYKATDDSEFSYIVIRCVEILKRYYDNLTMKDFRLAFEMSLTGALDAYLPKTRDGLADRGHYQRFNAEYICKILNAYKMRRDNVMNKAYEKMPVVETHKASADMAYYDNQLRSSLIEDYNRYKETKQFPNWTPVRVMLFHEVLMGCGLAEKVIVTDQEKEKVLRAEISKFITKGYVGDVRRLEKQQYDAPEVQSQSYFIAERRTVMETFERMDAQGIRLEDYIKTDN